MAIERVSYRIPVEARDELKERAEKAGMNMTSYLMYLLKITRDKNAC